MQTKKLAGWLILLIVWIGVFGVSGGMRSLSAIENDYRPYMAHYPSLRVAVMVCQFLQVAGIAGWGYTAWVLYRREPGTLSRAQTGLILGAFFRVAGGYSIPLLGGLPGAMSQQLMWEALPF